MEGINGAVRICDRYWTHVSVVVAAVVGCGRGQDRAFAAYQLIVGGIVRTTAISVAMVRETGLAIVVAVVAGYRQVHVVSVACAILHNVVDKREAICGPRTLETEGPIGYGVFRPSNSHLRHGVTPAALRIMGVA